MIYNVERPRTFDDMVGQSLVVENIRNQSIRDQFFPVFILAGQYGSGKTTMALLIAMAANCQHKDGKGNPCGVCESCCAVLEHNPEGVIEIDGASNNGVENIRNLLSQAETVGVFEKKVFIIDEAHMLSKSAFNALLITLENPPAHCIFILCTTEKDALPKTVVSRGPTYTFGKIPDALVKVRVLDVAMRNGIRISEDAVGLLSRYVDGALRNALKLLEFLSLQNKTGEEISDQDVICTLGLSSLEQRVSFLKACLDMELSDVIGILHACEEQGISLKVFLKDVLQMNADLLLVCSGAEVVGTEYYLESLHQMAFYGREAITMLSRLLSHLAAVPANLLSAERIVVEVVSDLMPVSTDSSDAKPQREIKSVSLKKKDTEDFSEASISASQNTSESANGVSEEFVPAKEKVPFKEESDAKQEPENDFFDFSQIFQNAGEEKNSSRMAADPLEKKMQAEAGEERKEEKQEEEHISWLEMAGRGMVPVKVRFPVPETDEQIDQEYAKEMLSVEDKEDNEGSENRAKGGQSAAYQALERLMKNPGFEVIFQKARVEERENGILRLYFKKKAFVRAASLYLKNEKVSGIEVLEESEALPEE